MATGHHALPKAHPFVLVTIKKRRDFQAATSGLRFSTPSFTLLRRAHAIQNVHTSPKNLTEASGELGSVMQSVTPAQQCEKTAFRFGFTVTKKLGNAVIRNRIRRRLKAAIVEAMQNSTLSSDDLSRPLDFVVLARHSALVYSYSQLVADFSSAVEKLATAPLEAKAISKQPKRIISPISSSSQKEGLAKPPPIA